MKKIVKTQTKTLTYSASTTQSESVERDGVITRIDAEVQVTPSATLVAANLPMGIFHVINTLRLVGGGGTNYFGMGAGELMGRMIHGINRIDYPWLPFVGPRDVTGPNQTFVPVVFRMHFGSRPTLYGRDNPFDLSAFVPAKRESSLRMEWGCPANSVVDGTVTISSATMKLTIYEILGSDAEIREEMVRQGLDPANPMYPISSAEQYTHTGTKSDLSAQFDVPMDGWLRRIGIMAQDATTVPLLANDEITRVGLIKSDVNERLIDIDFSGLVTGQMPNAAMELADEGSTTDTYLQALKGIGVLDLRQFGESALYGLDCRNKKNGTLKLGMTIGTYASGDDSFVWYDRLSKLNGAIMG